MDENQGLAIAVFIVVAVILFLLDNNDNNVKLT